MHVYLCMYVRRYVMEKGDVLIMDGNLVHSGDAGVDGCLAMRLHFYCNASTTAMPKDTTYPLNNLAPGHASKAFEALFKYA